jgi:hypothetical protein
VSGSLENTKKTNARIVDRIGIRETGKGEKSATTANGHGRSQYPMKPQKFRQHPPSPRLPQKNILPPSIQEVKALLLDHLDIEADEIKNATIREEHIHGWAKEGDDWYEFKIYRY